MNKYKKKCSSRKEHKFCTIEEKKQALQLYSEGSMSKEDLSKKFHVTEKTVRNWINGSSMKNQVESTELKKGQEKQEQTVAYSRKTSTFKNKSLQATNVTPSTSNNWLKEDKSDSAIKLNSLSIPILDAIKATDKMIMNEFSVKNKRLSCEVYSRKRKL